MEESDKISLCFLGEEYRKALAFCGRESGRNCDKLKECGLSTEMLDGVPAIMDSIDQYRDKSGWNTLERSLE